MVTGTWVALGTVWTVVGGTVVGGAVPVVWGCVSLGETWPWG